MCASAGQQFRRTVLTFALLIGAGGTNAARADYFGFTYSGGLVSVTAVLVGDRVGGQINVTSANGTFNGDPLVLMPLNAWGGNDNIAYLGAQTIFDFLGIAFSSGPNAVNLYYDNGAYRSYSQIGGVVADDPGVATIDAAPIPAPGVGLFSFAGLCIAGAATRFRSILALAKRTAGRLRAPGRRDEASRVSA